MFSKTFSVALCAAALSLCATVQAQWPIRYNNSSFNGNDEAFAVAVDRRGNVYTAGKSWAGSSQKFNFLVDSYDAAGFRRSGWPRQYDGPGHGDDIATSVHVDPSSGNVYVGGTSYGGTAFGADSGFDFCVIAYNSSGIPIWPASGSAGTGYVYHNGALRSTQSSGFPVDEGAGSVQGSPGTAFVFQVSMAVREDLSAENRVIAVTGIIARVNDPLGHYWRTVVFEPGSASPYYPVRKLGWPVDLDKPGDKNEIPQAVAIYTDNSVYVTGKSSPDGLTDSFTTIRYKPSGTYLNVRAWYWQHDWHPAAQGTKVNSGMDIALDRAGDAYATGYVTTNTGLDYGTVAIRKDADDSGAQVKWDDTWDRTADDRASSISLTFEVENGAVVPYVYVTGTSNSDIATLRYRGETGNLPLGWPAVYGGPTTTEIGYDVSAQNTPGERGFRPSSRSPGSLEICDSEQ